jgi:hypothetical protein
MVHNVARASIDDRAEMGDGIAHENKGTYSRVCVMLGAQWQPESAFHFASGIDRFFLTSPGDAKEAMT